MASHGRTTTAERTTEVQRATPADLVREVRAGDRSAEACLVAHYSPGLTYLLRRLTGDRALADDLHQETFRVVLEKVRSGDLREPERLAGFIRGTAKNLWTAYYRKLRRRGPTEEIGARDEPPDPSPSALSRVLREEDRRRVRRLLAELRLERDREILLRFHIAEQSKEEVCTALGLSPRQFDVTLFRARQRFRQLLERPAPAESAGRRTAPSE